MAVASRLDSVGNFTVANTGIFDEVSISDPNQYSIYSTSSNNSYLSISSAAVPATGPFTIEAWIYTSVSGTQTIYSQYLQSGDANRWHFSIDNNSGYKLTFAHGTAATAWGSTVVPLNQWNHVAVSRDASNNLSFFLNGVLDGTTSYTATLSQNAPRISGFLNTGVSLYNFQGYISNLRIISGTAYYTSSFIPSKSPLTAIPSTVLLTCQSSTIIDNSTSSKTITNAGLVTTYIPPQSDFYAATFNGSSQYISIPNAAGVASYASDFTIEFWFYATTFTGAPFGLAGQYKLSNGRSWHMYINSNGSFGMTITGFTGLSSAAGSVALNTWNHVAWVKNGATFYLYLNGNSVGTPTSSGTPAASTEAIFIASNNDSASPVWLFPGKISNFRIVKGTAVYTGSFTPSIDLAPISGTSVLTLQNSSLVDNSTNRYAITNGTSVTSSLIRSTNFLTTASQQSFDGNHKVGGIYDEVTIVPSNQYAAVFDGTTKYLNTPTSSAFNFGTNDFTIELWAYKNTSSADDLIITNRSSVSVTFAGDWWFDTNTGQIRLEFKNNSSTQYFVSNTGAVDFPVGQWFHIAAVKSGSTITGYLNGVAFGTVSVTGSFGTSTNGIYIGSFTNNSTWAWNGYVSNVRIVNGQAVYTQNFTPTRAPLTAIPGTVLLTCQNSTFVDNSTNGFTITNTGSVTTYKPPYPSFYAASFNGTSQYLTTGANSLTSQDFTFECWFYLKSNLTAQHASTGEYWAALFSGSTSGSPWFVISTTTSSDVPTILLFAPLAGSASYPSLTITNLSIPINTWHHVAVSRVGSTFAMWLNGTKLSITTSGTLSAAYVASAFAIGANPQGLATYPAYFPGYISNARIVRGNAVYDPSGGNITVPSSPLTAVDNTYLLTCKSSTLIDNSTNGFSITNNGSVLVAPASPLTTVRQQYSDGDYLVSGIFDEVTSINESFAASFNGSSQYLRVASNTAFAMGTGDFTFEFWLYPTSFAAGYFPLDLRGGVTLNPAPLFYMNATSGLLSLGIPNGSTTAYPAYASLTLNAWNHVAFVRRSGVTSSYTNGVYINGAADTNTYGQYGVSIGATGGSAVNLFPGYISNLRIVKGTAVYTGNFTPPKSHLTAIPGTVLLTCQSSTLVDNSTNAFTITNTGSVPTYKPPYSSFYAASFGATNQYLSIADNDAFELGSGDFTIETWMYLRTYSPGYGSGGIYFVGSMVSKDSNPTTNRRAFSFQVNGTASSWTDVYIVLFSNDSTYIATQGTYNFNLNTWYHVAAVRKNGIATLYVNGVSVGSGTNATAIQASAGPVTIGYTGYVASNDLAYWFPGYLSNVRIVKGVAVYTSDFTPPTKQLTNISGTSLLTCQNPTIIDNSTANAGAGFTITNTGPVTVTPREPF